MSNGTASMSVCVGKQLVCIKLAGRANFQCSVHFKTLIHSLSEKGHSRFVIDVTECQLMDSTFLGVLAALALRFCPQADSTCEGRLELLNPSERIYDMLDNLGIAGLFHVLKDSVPTGDFTPVNAPDVVPDRKETAKTCLDAHRLLMELNPANESKFKDVARFLEEDLQRLEKKIQP